MLSAGRAVLHTARPESARDRVRRYSRVTSLFVKEDHAVLHTTLDCDLVALKAHLERFEERLHEPVVSQFLDTSKACTGALYDLREALKK